MIGTDSFAPHIETVARMVLGAPNAALSSRREMRFGRKGSIAVNLDRGVWRDHENDVGGGVLALLRERGGMSTAQAMAWLSLIPEPQPSPAPSAQRLDTSREHTALALRIWNEALPIIGSPGETYFVRERRLDLVDDVHEVLRWHPSMPFAGSRTSGVVALVRNIITDEPQAVHRTAVGLDGRKAVVAGKDRLALGGLAGGAVKITADAEVTTCLGIGEGLESTLSLRRLPEFGASPVWSVLNAAGVAALPPLPGIESLWIAVDHDPAGERSAHACAGRWRFAGKEVFRVRAKKEGADLNDIVEARRV